MARDLAYIDEMFDEAEEPEISGKVPSGDYIVRVDSVELAESRDKHEDMLKWDLIIIEGDYEGRHLFRNNMLTNAQNLGFLKRDLRCAGINIYAETFKLSDFLTNKLSELLDRELSVTVRPQTKDPSRQNVYINEPVDGGLAVGSADSNSEPNNPFADE